MPSTSSLVPDQAVENKRTGVSWPAFIMTVRGEPGRGTKRIARCTGRPARSDKGLWRGFGWRGGGLGGGGGRGVGEEWGALPISGGSPGGGRRGSQGVLDAPPEAIRGCGEVSDGGVVVWVWRPIF